MTYDNFGNIAEMKKNVFPKIMQKTSLDEIILLLKEMDKRNTH